MIDGVLVDPSNVRISLDDGFVRGDGVFEGLRAYDRRPRTPDAHLDRLQRSANGVDIPLDRAALESQLAAFCAATTTPNCAIRVMVSRSGQVVWREEPLLPESEGLKLLPVDHLVTPLLIGSKTLSYAANMQAHRQAKQAGCDEALLVRANDQVVLEGPTSSFCWLENGVLVFPPLDVGVLDSITRRIAEAAVPSTTRAATLDSLADADGAMLISTVMEARPVAAIAGVATYDPTADTVISAKDAIRRTILEHVARD